MKLSVIIPVYNEKKTILEIVRRIQNLPIHTEIIILDGCSTDGTREVLNTVHETNVKVIFEEHRGGKGAAVKRGFQEATGDYVIVQDADLELNPEEYSNLLKPILEKGAEIVYGSRLLSGNNHFPIHTLFANKFLSNLTNFLYGSSLTDIETGFKLLPTTIAKHLPLECNGFDLDSEITVQLLNHHHKIHEVPVTYFPRDLSTGKKIHWTDGLRAIYVILKYKLKKVR